MSCAYALRPVRPVPPPGALVRAARLCVVRATAALRCAACGCATTRHTTCLHCRPHATNHYATVLLPPPPPAPCRAALVRNFTFFVLIAVVARASFSVSPLLAFCVHFPGAPFSVSGIPRCLTAYASLRSSPLSPDPNPSFCFLHLHVRHLYLYCNTCAFCSSLAKTTALWRRCVLFTRAELQIGWCERSLSSL